MNIGFIIFASFTLFLWVQGILGVRWGRLLPGYETTPEGAYRAGVVYIVGGVLMLGTFVMPVALQNGLLFGGLMAFLVALGIGIWHNRRARRSG
ncbi:MAG: hypothetical protein ACLFTK_18105 [Anaerolineales bacterium]